MLRRNPRTRMKPAEVEQRLRRLADVQTTVYLPRVPQRPIPQSGEPVRPRTIAGDRVVRSPIAVLVLKRSAAAIRVDRAVTTARRHGRLVAAAVAAMMLVSLGVAAEAVYRPDRFASANEAGGTATPRTTAPQASPATAAAWVLPTGFVLPAGFLWWKDPTGYQVARPATWSHRREAPTVMFFGAPGGAPTLRVRVWNEAGPDLLTALVKEEDRGLGSLPRYRRVQITTVAGGANRDTIWEYEFTDPTAGRMRTREHAFVAGGRTFVIQWRAPVAMWAASQQDLQVVRDSFRPGTRP